MECGHPERQSNCLSPDDMHSQLSQFKFSYCVHVHNVPRHQFSRKLLVRPEWEATAARRCIDIKCLGYNCVHEGEEFIPQNYKVNDPNDLCSNL